MKKALCAALFMGAFSTPALAGDVQLVFKGPSDAEPVSIWYRDVKPGQLPGLTALGADGSEWLVHITMTPVEVEEGQEPQMMFEATVRMLEADKKGRVRMTTVTRPTITAMVGQSASLRTGQQGQELSLELVYVEDVEPPSPSAPRQEDADTGTLEVE